MQISNRGYTMNILFTSMRTSTAEIFTTKLKEDFEDLTIHHEQNNGIEPFQFPENIQYEIVVMELQAENSITEVIKKFPKSRILAFSFVTEEIFSFAYNKIFSEINSHLPKSAAVC